MNPKNIITTQLGLIYYEKTLRVLELKCIVIRTKRNKSQHLYHQYIMTRTMKKNKRHSNKYTESQ